MGPDQQTTVLPYRDASHRAGVLLSHVVTAAWTPTLVWPITRVKSSCSKIDAPTQLQHCPMLDDRLVSISLVLRTRGQSLSCMLEVRR